jgi:hypothetical protein
MRRTIPFPTLVRNAILHADAPSKEKAQVMRAVFGG